MGIPEFLATPTKICAGNDNFGDRRARTATPRRSEGAIIFPNSADALLRDGEGPFEGPQLIPAGDLDANGIPGDDDFVHKSAQIRGSTADEYGWTRMGRDTNLHEFARMRTAAGLNVVSKPLISATHTPPTNRAQAHTDAHQTANTNVLF